MNKLFAINVKIKIIKIGIIVLWILLMIDDDKMIRTILVKVKININNLNESNINILLIIKNFIGNIVSISSNIILII